MTLADLEAQLQSLTPTEKAAAIQVLTQTLSHAGRKITKTSSVMGGDACIAGTRIAVWGLVHARQIGYSERDLLQSYPTLTAADLVNAWAYAEAYPEEVDLAIQENEAD